VLTAMLQDRSATLEKPALPPGYAWATTRSANAYGVGHRGKSLPSETADLEGSDGKHDAQASASGASACGDLSDQCPTLVIAMISS
jgi:hypothetical protein